MSEKRDLEDNLRTYTVLERVLARHTEMERELGEAKAAAERVATAQVAGNNRIDRYARKTRELERVVYHGGVPSTAIAPWVRHPVPSAPDPDDTQQNQIEDLRKALEAQKAAHVAEENRKRDSVIWWKRQRWQWTVGAAGALAYAAIIALVTYALTH